MAVSRKSVKEFTRPLFVQYEVPEEPTGPDDDGKLNFKFRPNIYTPNFEDELRAQRAAGEKTDTLFAQFRSAVTWWDLKDEFFDDGPDKPATTRVVDLHSDAELRDTPYIIFNDVFDAIGKANEVGETSAETSGTAF